MLSKFPFLALVAAFSTTVPISAAPLSAGVTENIVYGQAGGHDLKLDLHLPAKPASGGRLLPVVIYIHGGGWRVGSKAESNNYAADLPPNGFAVASIDYRLSGEARWPAQIFDCKTAVRWVRANARRYGLDPARIGVLGISAGGHLGALLGTTEGVKALEDRAEGSPGESSRVRAVCSVSGPVDMSIPTHTFIGRLCVLGEFGGSASEKPDLVRQADPSRYVKGGEPPFLLIHGDSDRLVDAANARKLEAALRAHGDNVTLDIVPGGKHVPIEGDKQRAEIVAFFMKHLGSK